MKLRVGRWAALAAAGALSIALAGTAAAQFTPSGDQPIDITANELELIDAQRVQIWRGQVEAVQGTNRLRTEVLQVFHGQKPGQRAATAGSQQLGEWGEPERMVAQGAVYFVTPESVARGDNGVYDLVRDVITITGNVIVTRGESVVRGDSLTIDVASGRSTLDSAASGRGTRRVRGVFYPEEQRAAAPAAAATPAPAPAPTRR